MAEKKQIAYFLSEGDHIGSHRENATAMTLLHDFKSQLPKYMSGDGCTNDVEKVATEYIQEVILSAAWYTRNIQRARYLRNIYLGVYVGLLVGIPLLLLWLGNKLSLTHETSPSYGIPLVTQVVLGLTIVVALQQMGNAIMDAHQRFGIWWRTASGLKTIWYGTLSTWSGAEPGTSGKNMPDFVLDLKASIAKARSLVSDEQQDFFNNLTKPFPDILNILSTTSKSVRGLIVDNVPDQAIATANAAAATKARQEIAKQQAIADQLNVLIDGAMARQKDAQTAADKAAIQPELDALISQRNAAIKAKIAAVGDLAATHA
jgi:hypothetical protein